MKGKIFMILFALPFFGIGVWMGYSVGTHLYDAWQVQAWAPVQAELHSAGYETHSGDDSDTYEAYAEFSYRHDGQLYVSRRVSLAGGSDNIGDFQQDLGRRLSGAMSRREAVTAWVDPDDPSNAVIDKTLRWGLIGFKSIFFLVFGGAGLGLIVFSLRAPAEKDLSAPRYADAPWLANDAWQGGDIRSSSKTSMWVAWGFAAFWNLVSSPVIFFIYPEVVEKGNTLALIALLFPLVGMGLFWWAIGRTLEWRRFGPAPVVLDPFPGAIGGHVGGTIDIRLPYDPGTRFSVTLTSLHSYMSGSGDNRSRRESAKWQDSQVAHATAGSKGTRLTFRFDVPKGLEESDAAQSGDAYNVWRLNLKATMPGTDIDRDYEIPVYATGAQSRELATFAINEAKAEQRDIDLDVIRDLVSLDHGMSGKSMLYPVGRNLYNGLVGFIFGAIFSAIGWFLVTREALWFMGGIFGLVGSVIAVSAVYYAFNSLEVIQAGDSLKTIRRVFGLAIRSRTMRRSDFVRFRKKSSMSTQQGTRHVMHYTLYAVDAAGRKLVVGEGFRGSSQAEAAADFIGREFGLDGKQSIDDASEDFGNMNVLTAD